MAMSNGVMPFASVLLISAFAGGVKQRGQTARSFGLESPIRPAAAHDSQAVRSAAVTRRANRRLLSDSSRRVHVSPVRQQQTNRLELVRAYGPHQGGFLGRGVPRVDHGARFE